MRSWRIERLEVAQGPFHLGPVSLEVEAGAAVAVLGPSGAGKTTLLRTIAGLLAPERGRVCADGADVTKTPPERRRVGYVPQGLALFPHRSVLENVTFAPSLTGAAEEYARALLVRFGLEGLARRAPAQLSSGEQQRVAIARALAARPELLLWDEPLTALDRAAREDLLEVLQEVRDRDRLPMLFVTHDPSLAFSIADRALVLESGSVEFIGPIERLLTRPTSPFVARFAGYENVLEPADVGERASAWGEMLVRRCGARGLCFRAPNALGPQDGKSAYRATIRRAEPRLGGWSYYAEVEGRGIRLRSEAATRARTGDTVGFDLREAEVIPLPAVEAAT